MILLYLDPGIGSVIIQAIIAGVIGFFYAIRMWGGKIKAFLKRKNK